MDYNIRPVSPGIETRPACSREREIFLEALELPAGGERQRFVVLATEENPALRAAVEALLAHHCDDGFLEQSATAFPREQPSLPDALTSGADERVGDKIGRFKLLDIIGEGGCGVVYLAEQQEPVRRRVALKVIKLGMDTRSVVARFEAERQALALMDHPNIARVLDGGATQLGRPYFVMELVQGVRITDFCRAQRLPLAGRIELFVQLCHAIQHAHQKGIIHRDIKPSNVLVARQDGSALPKVIDFGIAKAIEEPLTEHTVLTNYHAFIGTPAYTSPEQADMTGLDVDTRSDIYSLGVLLYELLTGSTPFDGKELTRSGLEQMRRMIREREPERPSARLLRTALTAPDPGAIPDGRIDPDLDWIVMKCLDKDRTRRYPTAQDLAADLQRYRRNEPVTARPPSPLYLLRKSMRRHRTTVLAGTAVVLALIAGATLSIWQAIRATQAEHAAQRSRGREIVLRQKAEREREKALENQRRAEINEYIADINLAEQALASGNLARTAGLLKKHGSEAKQDLRGFEWRYLWKLAQGDQRTLFAREPSSILALAVSGDARFVAVGLRDAIHIYDAATGALAHALAASGGSIAFSSSGLLAAAGFRNVHVWQTNEWGEVLSLAHRSGPVSFSASGEFLAFGSRSGVHVVKSSDGAEVNDLPGVFPPLAFAGSGNRLVANSPEGLVLWNMVSDTHIVLENSKGPYFLGWLQEKPVVEFSPDGRFVVAAQSGPGPRFGLEIWDGETGKLLDSLPSAREAPEHTGVISGVAFSADGRTLATSSWDHSMRLWDLPARRMIRTFLGNLSEVWSLAFVPGRSRLISGAKDGTVAVWPTAEPGSNRIEGDWRPLAFSPDGERLVAIQGKRLGLFRVRTAELEREIPAQLPDVRWRPMGPPVEPEISKDLRFLAIATESGARVLDLNTAASIDFASPVGRVDFVALSPDGENVVAGSWRGNASWWKTKGPRMAPRTLGANRVIFTDDSRHLFAFRSNEFEIWDVASGQKATNMTVPFPLGFNLALSPNGDILAVGSNPQDIENAIRLFDTRAGKLIGVCAGHTQGVGRFCFSPDGRTLASSSTDGTLRLWNVATTQQLLALQPGPVSDLLFSPDGSSLAVLTGRGAEASLRILAAPAAAEQ